MKIDAVPGIDTHLRVTPKEVGEYPVVCAELCGLGHSVMRQTAHVVSAQDFDSWLEERAAQAAEGGGPGGGEEEPAGGGGEAAAGGRAVFADAGCGACHALADAGTSGGVGPDLDDALQGRDEAFIRTSIVDPEAEIARGFSPGIMPPNFDETLTPEELDALVGYLAEVTQG
jgi:cytochrome c oxidase subunit 2